MVLTAQQLTAFALTLKPNDKVTVQWAPVVQGALGMTITWLGTVKTQSPDKTTCQMLYDESGGATLEFPPDVATVRVLTAVIKVVAAPPSMIDLYNRTSGGISVFDLATHVPLVNDTVGVLILMDLWRKAMRINVHLDLEHSQQDRKWARDNNYYEKDTLCTVLQAFYMTHLGEKDFHVPPKNLVARSIMLRLHAFKTADEGGSLYKYMQSVKAETEPEEFTKHARAAKKGKAPDE